MTHLKVLCPWDGWMEYDGTNLSWEADAHGLHIYDKPNTFTPKQQIGSHGGGCWQVVLKVE